MKKSFANSRMVREEERVVRTRVSTKVFLPFNREYCFSHYVTAVVLACTGYKLLFDDWRGYVVAGFSLVWIANVYMNVFGRLHLDLKHERVEIALEEQQMDRSAKDAPNLTRCCGR